MPPPKAARTAAPEQPLDKGIRETGLRIIINGVEGVGKTTLASHAPKPAIIMSPGETGYLTLERFRLVPDLPRFAPESWPAMMALLSDGQLDDFDTVVLDAMGGFERLCHEHVCARDFKGDWSEKGFLAYHKGYDIAVADWLRLLRALDGLASAGKLILLLSHVAVRNFRNPLGEDYDRYVADCHPKTWGVTHKWADAVLFYTFFSVVKQGKGVAGTTRVIYTARTDAYDAKNRFGLPDIIDIPDIPAESFNTLWQLIQQRKESK